ncbi:MAG: choice-of-anchor Q domain-containing protein [Flavobacteriales bacterium]
MKVLRFAVLMLTLLTTKFATGAVIYVDENAVGPPTGVSWTNAFTNLYNALFVAQPGDEIWVAAGVYRPTDSPNRNAVLVLNEGVALYGGFNGTETSRNQRNWTANQTVISGDIGIALINTDNSRRLINVVGTEVIVDGFRLRGCYDETPLSTGAINVAPGATLWVRNCSFGNNQAEGAAVAAVSGIAAFDNCLIEGNTNMTDFGLINGFAGGIIEIRHCTFSGNVLGGISNVIGGAPVADVRVYNSIIAEGGFNSSILDYIGNSVSEGPVLGATLTAENLITASPLFVNQAAGDFRLQASSPAIDHGSLSIVSSNRDLNGRPRVMNAAPDAGCYEYVDRPIVFVNPTATGNGSGFTWNNALTDLQQALAVAQPGEQIWVKTGIYKPSTTGNRSESFNLPPNVPVYGGFAGGENALGQRNLKENPSILSGDLGGPGTQDNTYNVVVCNDATAEFTLNGFEITNGTADGNAIQRQRGAGIRVNNASIVNVVNCDIHSNSAIDEGAGIYLQNTSQLNVVSSIIRSNIAPVSSAMFCGTANAYLESTALYRNANTSAVAEKGVITSTFGAIDLINCTVSQNTFVNAANAYLVHSYVFTNIRNSIISGNDLNGGGSVANITPNATSVSFSIIEGDELPQIGEMVSFGEPGFLKPTDDDYRLILSSFGFNTGDTTVVLSNRDANGAPRVALGQVDFGAYEAALELLPVIYVNAAATGSNNGSSWVNAFTDLQHALSVAMPGEQIWVASGAYKPTTGTDRDVAFEIPGGVSLLGGFSGTETRSDQRNWVENVTVLSGEIGVVNDLSDNTKVLIRVNFQDDPVIIDGFSIRRSFSEGSNPCLTFTTTSKVIIRNCVLNNNHSNFMFLYSFGAEIELVGCLLANNVAEILLNAAGTGRATLNSVTIAGNSIIDIFSASDQEFEVTNSILWQPGVATNFASLSIHNSIVPNTSFFANSNTVLLADPLFVNPNGNDYRLSANSPALDFGGEFALNPKSDLNLTARVYGSKPDAGCYEWADRQVWFVDQNATGGGTGRTWNDAFKDLQSALTAAQAGSQVWVTDDVYTSSDVFDVDAFFDVPDDVHLIGGFNGGETSTRQRNGMSKTVIDGYLGENALGEIVRSKLLFNISSNGIGNTIDGFELRNAQEDLNASTTARALNVVASNNVDVLNCHIHSNSSRRGSALFLSSSSALLENCLIESNTANETGCIHLLGTASLSVVHTTIVNNTRLTSVKSPISGTNQGTLFMRNSILWQEDGGLSSPNISDVTNCLLSALTLQNGEAVGNNIIGVSPEFEADSYRLTGASPARDAGAVTFSSVSSDLDGRPRVYGPSPDLGCYEFEDKPVVFVDQSATGFRTGRSWADAFPTLQEALSEQNGNQIWVAAGTYYPTDNDNRLDYWYLLNGTDVYGGFAGVETSRDERNWALNEVIFSGEIGDVNTPLDNSILLFRIEEKSTMSGVTITGANNLVEATTEPGFFRTGVIYFDSGVEFSMTHCITKANANTFGLFKVFTSATVGTIEFQNCLFIRNNIGQSGLISLGFEDNISVSNCTFSENSRSGNNNFSRRIISNGSQLFGTTSGSKVIENTIIWQNPLIQATLNEGFDLYNCILSDAPLDQIAENVSFSNPLFASPQNDDFTLTEFSPALDAGNNAFVESTLDLTLNPRIQGNAVDLGCFESPYFFNPTPDCPGDFDGDFVVGASDLLIFLAEFGCPSNCATDLNGDDSTGTADLLVFLSVFGSTCNF